MEKLSEEGVWKQLQHAIMIRRCPITGGRPTRMTSKSFDSLCRARRKAAGKPARKGVYSNCCGTRLELRICLECKGKTIPLELELVQDFEARSSGRDAAPCSSFRAQRSEDPESKKKTGFPPARE